jgi:hypothetical protein
MSATTSRLSLPYPQSTDAPNGPAQIEALANALDAVVPGWYSGTAANRSTVVSSPKLGNHYWETDTGKLDYYNGTTWIQLGVVNTSAGTIAGVGASNAAGSSGLAADAAHVHAGLGSFQGRTATAAVLTKADVTGTGLTYSDVDADVSGAAATAQSNAESYAAGAATAAVTAELTAAATLTNKRITKRVLSLSAASATPAINTDNYDVVHITAQGSTAITSFTSGLSGTPVDGDTLRISVIGSGAVGLTFGASFEASGNVALPTTTVAGVRLDMGFFWNTETNKWRCEGWA